MPGVVKEISFNSWRELLALSEYASMYLFAWSDVVWPDDLPTAEAMWEVNPEARPHVETLLPVLVGDTTSDSSA
jgi:hypothetical protein